MKILGLPFAIFVAGIIASTTPSLAQQSPNLAGDYAGMSGPLHVTLHLVAAPDGSLKGTIDSPDQRMFGLPCADLHQSGQGLSFAVPNVRGSWTGFISSDGNSLSGTWNQGNSVPLNLTRVGTKDSTESASPMPPRSYAAIPTPPGTATATGCPANFNTAGYWDDSGWKIINQAVAMKAEASASFKAAMRNPLLPGLAGATTIFQYKDASATLTVGASPKFCFTFTGGVLPVVYIGVVEVKKDTRQIELKRDFNRGANSMVPLNKSYDADVSQVSETSIEVTPKQPLPPGQYVIAARADVLFDFGVK
jgi:hypothetical protein